MFSNHKNFLISGTLLLTGGFLVMGLGLDIWNSRLATAQTFTGPDCAAGQCQGAIAVDSSNNLSIGTTTVFSDTRLFIQGGNSTGTQFAIQLKNQEGRPMFVVRNDGRTVIGPFPIGNTPSIPSASTLLVRGLIETTSSVNPNLGGGIKFPDGTIQTTAFEGSSTQTLNAANVSSGDFGGNTGGGNYSFPANLSVGTTTATARLVVGQVSGSNAISVLNTSLTGGKGWTFYNQTNGSNTDLGIWENGVGNKIMIQAGGNVGIGTSTPTAKLHIYGTYPHLRIGGTGQYNGVEFLETDNSGAVFIGADTTNDLLRINANNAGYGIQMLTQGVERLRVTSAGVGIGTTTPSSALEVVGLIKDKTGALARNLLDTTTWTISSGSIGNWSRNGADSENVRVWGLDPHGGQSMLWSSPNDAASDGDGGWNYTNIPIDPNKAYRASIWIKQTGGTGGTHYFGASGGNTLNLNGTTNNNPYYCTIGPSTFTVDKWYLFVGYLHANGDTSATSYGGVYDGVTGVKIANCTDYRNNTGSVQTHRAYHYYDTNVADTAYFWGPRFEEIDGNEPSISAMISQQAASATVSAADVSSGDFGVNTGGGNYTFPASVGVGTTSPTAAARLTVTGSNGGIYISRTASWIDYNATGGNYFGGVTYFRGVSTSPVNAVIDGEGTSNTYFSAAGGNVGIGINVPTAKLHLAPGAGTTGFEMGSNGTFNIDASGVVGGRFVILENGNVGIGTSTPTSKLSIHGSLSVGTTTTGLIATFGGGSGKINVGTIDPVYTIGGERFATYMPGMTGQKEETTGHVSCLSQGGRCSAAIDFKDLEKASDLWLFGKASNLVKDEDNFRKMTIMLTPEFDGRVWYKKDIEKRTVFIYADAQGSAGEELNISYRMTSPRFDALQWGNVSKDNDEGFNLDKLIK